MIEKLLKQTKFKDDAAEIVRQFKKVNITTLDRLNDAPALLRSVRIWGHPLSEVIRAIKEAAEKEASKTLKTEIIESVKPVKAETGENK